MSLRTYKADLRADGCWEKDCGNRRRDGYLTCGLHRMLENAARTLAEELRKGMRQIEDDVPLEQRGFGKMIS